MRSCSDGQRSSGTRGSCNTGDTSPSEKAPFAGVLRFLPGPLGDRSARRIPLRYAVGVARFRLERASGDTAVQMESSERFPHRQRSLTPGAPRSHTCDVFATGSLTQPRESPLPPPRGRGHSSRVTQSGCINGELTPLPRASLATRGELRLAVTLPKFLA